MEILFKNPILSLYCVQMVVYVAAGLIDVCNCSRMLAPCYFCSAIVYALFAYCHAREKH